MLRIVVFLEDNKYTLHNQKFTNQ